MSRQSVYPSHTRSLSTATGQSSSSSSSSSSTNRARQYAHLHAALAQLNAHLADTDNLLRMTAVQAEYMRGLGGWTGGLFMAAAKVLGEEVATGAAATGGGGGGGASGQNGGRDDDQSGADPEASRTAGESTVFDHSVTGA